jgi:1-aminocyclopropane-1-carboxylate deaminase
MPRAEAPASRSLTRGARAGFVGVVMTATRASRGTASLASSKSFAVKSAAWLDTPVITDPVYEGKSMAGLINLVSSGEIEAGSTVLYAYLGGQPVLNAYGALFH